MPDPADDDVAARLIGALIGPDAEVEEGQFTLDPAAAAAKLAAFAYADRSVYLVPLVEGLLGLGAREIKIEATLTTLEVRAGWIELEGATSQLVNLYGFAQGSTSDPRLRALGRLAVGIDMVLDGPEVVVEVQTPGVSATLVEYRARAAPRVRARDEGGSSAAEVHGFEVRVRLPLSLGVGQAIEEALTHLRVAVRHSEHLITIEGRLVGGQPRTWLEGLRVTGEGPGYRFHVGLENRIELAEHAWIEWWTGGLMVQVEPSPGKSFRALIELDSPRRDLSQIRLVRDATVERALAAVEAARVELLARLAALDRKWTALTRPPEWPPERVDALLGREPRPTTTAVAVQIQREPQTIIQLGMLAYRMPDPTARWGLLYLPGLVAGFAGLATCLVGAGLGEDTWVVYGFIAFALGLGAMFPALRLAYAALRAREHGVRATAKIAGFEPQPDGGFRVSWTFLDENNELHTGRSLVQSNAAAKLWPVHGPITIFYDRLEPDHSWWEADVGPRRARR